MVLGEEESVLFTEVSLFQGCPYRGVPLYIIFIKNALTINAGLYQSTQPTSVTEASIHSAEYCERMLYRTLTSVSHVHHRIRFKVEN